MGNDLVPEGGDDFPTPEATHVCARLHCTSVTSITWKLLYTKWKPMCNNLALFGPSIFCFSSSHLNNSLSAGLVELSFVGVVQSKGQQAGFIVGDNSRQPRLFYSV